MKHALKAFTLIFVIIISSSCEKFDEGGLVRKAEKNLTSQSWKLTAYLRNGNDETSQLIISNLTESFNEGGVFVRSYNDSDGSPFNEEGQWMLENDDMQVGISSVSSVEFTSETGTLSSAYYDILLLDKEEFWYTYENGGDMHEFHFVAN